MGDGKVCTKWSTAKLLNYLNISNIRAFYSLRQIWAESLFSFQSYRVKERDYMNESVPSLPPSESPSPPFYQYHHPAQYLAPHLLVWG
jgi:hypothetical protein